MSVTDHFIIFTADCGGVSCDGHSDPEAYLDTSCTCQCHGWPVKACGNNEPDGPGKPSLHSNLIVSVEKIHCLLQTPYLYYITNWKWHTES